MYTGRLRSAEVYTAAASLSVRSAVFECDDSLAPGRTHAHVADVTRDTQRAPLGVLSSIWAVRRRRAKAPPCSILVRKRHRDVQPAFAHEHPVPAENLSRSHRQNPNFKYNGGHAHAPKKRRTPILRSCRVAAVRGGCIPLLISKGGTPRARGVDIPHWQDSGVPQVDCPAAC